MKEFKRVLSVVLTVMLLATGLIATLPVSAAQVNYEFKLGLNNIKDDYYEFMAYDITNKQLKPLEAEARQTWSPDWPGHFVAGQDYYVVGKPETDGYIVDLVPRTEDKCVPAIVFTAPADGKYNVIVKLLKRYPSNNSGTSFVDVLLVNDTTGEVLLREDRLEEGDLEWVKKNIELKAGEKVFVAIVISSDSTRDSGHNVALSSVLVNEAIQQTTTPEDTTASDTTTGAGETDAPDNGGNEKATDDFNPIIIVAIVGGALVLAAVIVVIVVKVKKKK